MTNVSTGQFPTVLPPKEGYQQNRNLFLLRNGQNFINYHSQEVRVGLSKLVTTLDSGSPQYGRCRIDWGKSGLRYSIAGSSRLQSHSAMPCQTSDVVCNAIRWFRYVGQTPNPKWPHRLGFGTARVSTMHCRQYHNGVGIAQYWQLDDDDVI